MPRFLPPAAITAPGAISKVRSISQVKFWKMLCAPAPPSSIWKSNPPKNQTRRSAHLRELGPVCVSYHNFEKTPALEPVLRRLSKQEADAYKIAITARKPTDNLRLCEFARAHHDRSISSP